MYISPYYTKLNIELGSLTRPTDICRIMECNRIEKYAYSFQIDNEVLKYGISTTLSGPYGERIYRQAGHLNGWTNGGLSGCSGSDMRNIQYEYQDLNNKAISRNDVSVEVIDLSSVSNNHIRLIEKELIDRYIKEHRKAPIGNKDRSTVNNVERRLKWIL